MRSWAQDQKALDLLAADHMPECPICHELNEPGATTCVCGAALYQATVDVLDAIDSVFAQQHSSPDNVVALDNYSKRVP